MTGRIAWRATTLLVVTLWAVALASCGRSGAPAKEAAKPSEATPAETRNPLALTEEEIKQAGIEVEAVQPRTLRESITLTGSLVPNGNRIAAVAARLPGRIASVEVALGARVKARQTLAVLESIELGEARAAYLQARSEATVAQATLVRAEKLAAEEIVPQKDYLRAKADTERAQAALAAAAGKLKIFGVSASAAEKQEADAAYPLTAPFAGTIIEKKAVPGELAQPDQILFTVADLSTVWLNADVFEKDLGRLALGARAVVTVAAYPEAAYEGKLTYLADTMDKTTRTVKGRIEVPNPDGRLKPGMFATAGIGSTAIVQGLAVPRQAVSLVQGRPSVFIATAQGFIPRAVETGPAADGRIPITAGLAPGEQVVVAGAYELKARLLKSQIGTED